MTSRPTIVQINLSPTLGGAEVYTAFMSRALAARGWPTRVLVDARALFWRDLDFGGVELIRVTDVASATTAVTGDDIVLIHGSLPAPLLSMLQKRAPLVGVAHQAIYAGSRPAYYDSADLLLGVSEHVIKTLRDNGVANVYGEPLYGVGEIARRHHDATPRLGPPCEWDEHKPRDRVLALGEKVRRVFGGTTTYARRRGLTLGIVSRLAPLKQFPALFEILAPVIAAQPEVNLEIFGVAVGYKALREMRAALRPLKGRARLWGHQRDVAPAYRGIDYLLTGLPEREALGLNVIESCLCGTPVLAVDAPPFTETMSDGITGFLYTDPRRDRGAHFARILAPRSSSSWPASPTGRASPTWRAHRRTSNSFPLRTLPIASTARCVKRSPARAGEPFLLRPLLNPHSRQCPLSAQLPHAVQFRAAADPYSSLFCFRVNLNDSNQPSLARRLHRDLSPPPADQPRDLPSLGSLRRRAVLRCVRSGLEPVGASSAADGTDTAASVVGDADRGRVVRVVRAVVFLVGQASLHRRAAGARGRRERAVGRRVLHCVVRPRDFPPPCRHGAGEFRDHGNAGDRLHDDRGRLGSHAET